MPELPEVEVTRRALEPLVGRRIRAVVVREPRLRWPVPPELAGFVGRRLRAVRRRGKYLLLDCGGAHLILHLGMSGSLRLVRAGTPAGPHEHVDITIAGRLVLRLRDPRRFGAVLCTGGAPEMHPLLAHLGVEPLAPEFDGARLHALARGRRISIKQLLMDARRIAGLGNIYASEALFLAGIHPARRASSLSAACCARLARAIRRTLRAAIRAGGSTLRDFVGADGTTGCFQLHARVYGRAGEPCRRCGAPIRRFVQGQRASYYCPRCQR